MPASPAVADVEIDVGTPPAGPALVELLGFLDACGDRFGEEQLMALRGDGGEVALAVTARALDGRLLAYGQVLRGRDHEVGELALGPAAAAIPGLAAAMVLHLVEGAASPDGRPLEIWSRHAGKREDAAAARVGLAVQRRLLQMRRPLPLEPGGAEGAGRPLRQRAFRVGKDEEAFLEVNARAFAALPDQGGWTLEALLARERQPWFDPAGFLLHEQQGRLAAFCWTKLHRHDGSVVGEIYVIGVDPAAQRRGLGGAMLRAGCEHLARAGAAAVMLYVDAANSPALAMYDRRGFGLDHEDHCYAFALGAARS